MTRKTGFGCDSTSEPSMKHHGLGSHPQCGPDETPPCLLPGPVGLSQNRQATSQTSIPPGLGDPPRAEGVYRRGSDRNGWKGQAGFTTPSSAAADVEISTSG